MHWIRCGKCHECIKRKRNDWAFRMEWEAKKHSTAYFTLLTYDMENVPILCNSTGAFARGVTDASIKGIDLDNAYQVVEKSDCQKFIKDLRSYQNYWSKIKGFENTTIRYFLVSEYGEETKRPHYHCILWGVNPLVANRIQDKIWARGFANPRPLDPSRAPGMYRYVTKYMYKQQGQEEDERIIKPFALMSKKPFIGDNFLSNTAYMVDNNTYVVKIGGYWRRVPDIYIKKGISRIKKDAISMAMLKSSIEVDNMRRYEAEKKGKNYDKITDEHKLHKYLEANEEK